MSPKILNMSRSRGRQVYTGTTWKSIFYLFSLERHIHVNHYDVTGNENKSLIGLAVNSRFKKLNL